VLPHHHIGAITESMRGWEEGFESCIQHINETSLAGNVLHLPASLTPKTARGLVKTDAVKKRWTLQRLHQKTVFAELKKCIILVVFHNCSTLKDESKKVMFFVMFIIMLIFLMKGKLERAKSVL
jgi:hypothetical protein